MKKTRSWGPFIKATAIWQPTVLLTSWAIITANNRPNSLWDLHIVLSILTIPLCIVLIRTLRGQNKQTGPHSKADRARHRMLLMERRPRDHFTLALGQAFQNFGKNVLWGLAATLAFSLLYAGLLAIFTNSDFQQNFSGAFIFSGLLFEIPIIIGSLLKYTPAITESAIEARSLIRERRDIKNSSELTGGLEVSTPSTSGDLSMTQEAGGLAMHEEASTDVAFDFQAKEEAFPQEIHVEQRHS